MKKLSKMRERGKGIIDTMIRFPLLVAFLAAAVISNMIAIYSGKSDPYAQLLITFILGGSIYAVFQMIYERFFNKPSVRIIFMVTTIILSLLYYVLIKDAEFNIEITIRTIVILFVLLISFLWVPVIKSRIHFNQSFMAGFKAFFMAAFFNTVLFLGIVLIIGVTNILIFRVNEDAYSYTANVIFILFAPIHFLSLIPYYPKKEELEKVTLLETNHEGTDPASLDMEWNKANITQDMTTESQIEILLRKREDILIKYTTPAKFLEALVSFVIIPIAAVFTVILLLYIIINITGDFWTNNLLEPMLVSYSIVVIIIYLLSSTINNVFTKFFRMIFPKVLVPVVLFQTVASILKIQDMGISYGRYYSIMFGIFATIAGLWFCFKPISKNGMIAPILIGLSILSILPFIDVFTISKANQLSRLVNALERNEMFDGEKITPNSDISDNDKKIIITSVQYLDQMNYVKEIDWLENYSNNYNFEKTFGFNQYNYNDPNENENKYFSIVRDQKDAINVVDYDFMTRVNIYKGINDEIIGNYIIEGKTYTLTLDTTKEENKILFLKEDGKEINRFELNVLFNKFTENQEKAVYSTKEVTFTQENENSVLTLVAENISVNEWESGRDEQADVIILVKIE